MPDLANTPRPSSSRAPALAAAVAVIAGVFLAAFVATAIARQHIDAPLSDVMLGTVQHVQRVLTREPLYAEPTAAFVPLQYPPLYYYASAAVARLMGDDGFRALRVTSLLATLMTLAVIGAWVRRETHSYWAAWLAVGLYAATYRVTDAWFDVERVDALFVLLTIAALYVFRFAETDAGVVASALLCVLATLTKQTAWLVTLGIAASFAVTVRRRAVVFVATVAAAAIVSTWWLTRFEGPLYSTFVYAVGGRSLGLDRGWSSWITQGYDVAIREFAAVVPLALALPVAMYVEPVRSRIWLRPAAMRLIAVAWSSVAAAALVTQIVHDSRRNVLMPVFAMTAVVFAVAVHALLQIAHDSSSKTFSRLVHGICLAQFAMLAYVPWHLVQPFPAPSRDDVLVISGPPAAPLHATAVALEWRDALHVRHADFSAAADLLSAGPPELGRRFGSSLGARLCAATDADPVTVFTMFFDPEWQEKMRALTHRPLPLPATIETALSTCRSVAVQ